MNAKIALAAALAALVMAGCAKKEEAVEATQEAAADRFPVPFTETVGACFLPEHKAIN